MLKRILVGIMLLMGSMLPAQSASAADFELQNTMEDALYGGAIGALIGAGAMLASGSPSNHWDYLLTGAGIGIIGGAIYGMYTSTRSLATYEDGRLRLAAPTPGITLAPNGQEMALNMGLFSSRF